MLTKQDIKTIESSMLKVFEQKFMPQLLRVFVTKEDLKQEFANMIEKWIYDSNG